MAEQNICRPIVLYNNFIPATKREQPWSYCTFGMVDGIDIGENLIKSEEQDLLAGIWHEQSNFCGKLNGNYTAQQIFVIRYGEVEEEQNFWDQDGYPFLFFCRMQCYGNRKAFWEKRQELENALQFKDSIKTMIYLTYDNSDIVIVLRSKRYGDGAGIINAFHQCNSFSLNGKIIGRLKNSFSVMSIKYEWLEKMETYKEFIYPETTLNAHISIVERRTGGVEYIYKELLERKTLFSNTKDVECSRFPVLGSNDEEIVINNICWSDFLPLYKKEAGIFCNSNDLFHENVACITTEITVELEDYRDKLAQHGINFLDNSQGFGDTEVRQVEAYSRKVSELFDLLKELNYSDEDLKEIRLIFNALPKFSGKIFNDYTLFPVLNSLKTLLKLLPNDKSPQYFDKGGFFEFLNTFCLYVQNSMRSDRMTMQTMDFNVKMYDVPTKLIAFYSAYVAKVCEILSKNDMPKCKYDFLTIPGMSSFISVKELFKRRSYDYRLIQIRIPEYNFYDTKDVMIVLAHEVAHYVGREYRHRKKRYETLIANYAHIYVKYLRSYSLREPLMKSIPCEAWIIAEKRMTTMLTEALEREKDAEFLQRFRIPQSNAEQRSKILKANEKYAFHFPTVCRNIDLAMHDIIQYGLEDVFSILLYEKKSEEKKEVLNWLQEVSLRYMFRHEDGSTLLTSQEALKSLRMIYSESFADLMMSLLLQLNMEDYIFSLVYNWKQQCADGKKLVDTEVLVRIALVLIVISRSDHEYVNYLFGKEWKDEECREIANKAFQFWVSFTSGSDHDCIMEDNDKLWINIFGDKQILEGIYNYLEACRRKFADDSKETDNQQAAVLRKCYNICSAKDISAEEQIICITEFIEEYKNEYLMK